MHEADVAVIGAGPAGLAAAGAAAAGGARVVLVDAAARLGGQYWRHAEADEAPGAPAPPWHHGWPVYTELARAVHEGIAAGTITHLAETHVFALDQDRELGLVLRAAPTQESGRPQRITSIAARSVVLAPGAYDRQLPIPGWDLPGVMAAGGIQAFVKVQGAVPGRRVLIAGTGPFLLAAASTVLQAGGEVVAICESADLTGWVPRGASAALVPSKGVEGAEYVARLARHRVPYLRRRVVTEIRGDGGVESVVTQQAGPDGSPVPGSERIFEGVDLVGLGWGFVPQAELLLQTGAETRLDVDGSLVGVVDGEQASTVPGVFLAGEITGVTGAVGAVAEGRIAGAAAAARATGRSARRQGAAVCARTRHRAFARAMHRAHPSPSGWEEWMRDETVVCRCEEVTYDVITSARDGLALPDPRSLKGETRAGMGLCQGRMCGFAMTCLAASGPEATRPDPEAAARQVSARPLSLPLTLGALTEEDPTLTGGTEETIPAPLPAAENRT